MSHPRRWAKRLAWLILSAAVLFLCALLVVNVIDYRRYYWAAHFEQSVGLARVRELAKACFDLGKDGRVRLETYPPIIAQLKPQWASVSPEYAQIGLYGHLDGSVFLVFTKYDGNEVAVLCDYVRGISSRTIHVQDQTAYEVFHPKNRIVTLSQGAMHGYIEWIVLPDEVRVIGNSGSGGSQVLGRRPISTVERQAVESAIHSISATVRGRYSAAGVVDGIQLGICFGADGQRGPADIELANTWREEAGPLVDLVAQLSPQGKNSNSGQSYRRN